MEHASLPTVELVRLMELDAQVSENQAVTIHEDEAGQTRTWKRGKKLGSGGFGTVYREDCVEGELSGAVRAVKCIALNNATHGKRGVDYGRELKAVAKFSQKQYSDFFIESYGWYKTIDTLFLAMEFVEHGDLTTHMAEPFPEAQVRQIIYQVLGGLSHMHGSGYVHRDLKPANLLVSIPAPWWHIKIADFGLSKSQSAYASLSTNGAGTEGYLAPETLGLDNSEDEQYDRRHPNAVDIWAVGIIAFELLAGEIPFQRHDLRALGLYARGRGELPLQKLDAKNLSVDGQAAIRRFLSARPIDRPAALPAREDTWFARLADLIPTADDHSSSGQHGDSQGSARWTAKTSQYQSSAPADRSVAYQGSLMPLGQQRRPYSSTKDSGYQSSATQSSTRRGLVRENQKRPLPQIRTDSSTSSTDVPHQSLHDSQRTSSEPRHRDSLIKRKTVAQEGVREVVQVTKTKYQLVKSTTVDNTAPDYWCKVSLEGGVALGKGSLESSDFCIWDTMTGSKVSVLRNLLVLKPSSVSFSKDNRLLLASSELTMRASTGEPVSGDYLSVWELTSGDLLWQHEGHYAAVAMSPDGNLIAAASRYEGVQLWGQSMSTELLLLARGLRCTLILFSPDSRLLASASTSSDSMVIVWDTKGPAKPVHLKTSATEMAFSPNGRLIATAAAATVRLWEVATGREVGHFSSNRNQSTFSSDPELNRLSFVSNMELLALSLDERGHALLQVFDVTTGVSRDLSLSLDGSSDLSSHGVALTTDGGLISCSKTDPRGVKRTIHAIRSLGLSPPKKSLVISVWKKVEF